MRCSKLQSENQKISPKLKNEIQKEKEKKGIVKEMV